MPRFNCSGVEQNCSMLRLRERIVGKIVPCVIVAHEKGRRLLLLRPHAAPSQVAKREEDDEAGAVLLLDTFDSYVAFAEALARLGSAGWIDGQEILILVREGGSPMGRRSSIWPRWNIATRPV